MRLIDRAKNIIVTPKTEWDAVAADPTPTGQIITGYVLPLAAVSAIAAFIGSCFVGTTMPFVGTFRMPIMWGVAMLVYHIVMAVVTVFVLGFIIEALAPTFGAQKDRAQAIKVAAYSYTPAWVAGILMIIPMLGILMVLAGLYGIYLLYLGLPRLMKNPPDKSAVYTVVVVVCAIVLSVVIGMIAGAVTTPAMMGMGGMGVRTSSGVIYDKDSNLAKLDAFSKKMEEAGKKMDEAQKSGDANKTMEAALGTLGTAISGGKGVEPVQLDQLKPLVPETLAGMPRTDMRTERSGVPGLMVAKAEATYADTGGGKNVQLEISDTGGAAGLMALASWAGVVSEKEQNGRVERTRKEGNRMVHEESDKAANQSKYTVVLAERFVVSAEGNGVELGTLKSAVNGIDLGKIESLK